MKNRKISTAIAEKVMTGVLTILMAISVTACGSTKEQENSAATEVTEAVVTTETESETATEAKVENAIVTETEEPVLFRVKVTNSNGAYLTDQPSDKEYHDFILTDYGTEFDVLEVFNNEAEGYTFYRVNWNGHREFLWDRDATVID
ncbi:MULTISPECIES: hypothetical protein [Roseburia]|uniref:hypothetical protein n=1 Tax=Roseburia TaxID=841 RepID=UPI001D0F96F6|nr:hypothetical protein [Roseburia sp. CLA-AA-H209]MCC2225136.1 hypothetical protein [Roseburia sp. CLA-AA-H209]